MNIPERKDLEGAKLERAYLVEANLEGAYLIGDNLEGANLEGANLQGAKFEGAKLKGAHGLSLDQLSKVKTLFDSKLDEELLILLKKKYPALFKVSNQDEWSDFTKTSNWYRSPTVFITSVYDF